MTTIQNTAVAAPAEVVTARESRAALLLGQGRLEEALREYEQILTLRRDSPEVLFGKSRILLLLQRWEEALASIEVALSLGPPTAPLLTMKGVACNALRRWPEGLETLELALGLDRNYAAAWINRGTSLHGLKRLDEALASHAAALALEVDSAPALMNRLAVLLDLERYDEVLADSERAADIAPLYKRTFELYRAKALAASGRTDQALAAFDAEIAQHPQNTEALYWRAWTLAAAGRDHEALLDCERVLALTPDFPDALLTRSAILIRLDRPQEARSSLERLEAAHQDDPARCFEVGCLYLQLGHWERGWRGYLRRPKRQQILKIRGLTQRFLSAGDDLGGKTLFVHTDQGLGDAIQFARYVRIAERRGATVVLAVQERLHRLLRSLTPDMRLLPAAHEMKEFDFQCELSTLAAVFWREIGAAAGSVPYLRAEPERIACWRNRLGSAGLKVGVCWQGGTRSDGRGRAFPLRALKPLTGIDGIRLISLQAIDGVEQIAAVKGEMSVECLGDDFDAGPDGFVDAAAVIECLDLVITCDTSIAHLAGALGRPTWVALCRRADWRWMTAREDSPWYPGMRLFRQDTNGRWEDVFQAMRARLAPMAQATRA